MRLVKWSRKTMLLSLVAVLALGAGVAVSQNNGPRTDGVEGTFQLERTQVAEKECLGQDGPYTEQRATYEGASESDDPRLNGRLKVRLKSLVNQADVDDDLRVTGTTEGHFIIYREDGGTTTGNFYATITGEAIDPEVRVEGTAVGRVTGPAQEVGGTLIGAFSAEADRSGEFSSGQFGGTDDDNEQPAFIQSGHCQGSGQ